MKSKDLSAEKLTTPTTTDNILSSSIKQYGNSNLCLRLKGRCLKQKNATYTPANRIIFFVYELDTWSQDFNSDFILKDCLFGAVKLDKNTDPDKCVCSRYGTGFDFRSELSLPGGSVVKNVIIFNVRTSVHIDNKKKRYLNSWYRSNTRIRIR